MIQFSSQYIQQFHNRIKKFESLYRGFKTREHTVFTNSNLEASVCKQIHSFLKLNRNRISDVTAEISEGRRFFIKWDKNRNELLLLFPRENVVGSGAWKKFLASSSIKIPLTSKKNEISKFESVWIEADNKTVNEVRLQRILYEKFIKEKPVGVYFLEPWEHVHQNVYTQRRLINTLDEMKFNDPFQKSHCIRDIARNLAWMHKQGMIHGDVSLKNILAEEGVDHEGISRFISYLTDFGSTKTCGASQDRKLDDYVRWDPCKCFADVNTPLTDWYGFITTNILAWFPEMSSHLKWDHFISTRQKIFDNESVGNFVSDASYWTGNKPFRDLSCEEQQVWHLFVSICRKSSQVYQYFKDNPGVISKEKVEQAMAAVKATEIVEGCMQFANMMCKKAR